MHYPEVIKAALAYIEQNLKTDITAEELAQMAGYATYHYYRLFSAVTGSSIASYILQRRLDHALAEIAAGRKAIDVVLEYGFDTYAGFYKAFVRMYGCSPRNTWTSTRSTNQQNRRWLTCIRKASCANTGKLGYRSKSPITDIYLADGRRCREMSGT